MILQKPLLLLFFSVDLIGSTAFKQKNIQKDNLSSNWKKNFQDFYNNFKIEVQQAYCKIDEIKIIEEDEFYYPYMWKFLGDEIIFMVHISDFRYIYPHVEAFKKALADYNVEEKKLKVRLSSWLAQFPVVNTVLGNIEPNTTKEICSKTEVDFLGPSLDLGFRIAKYSTERKVVISVDLAFVLLKHCLEHKINPYHFYFDKNQDAKGLNNNKYPIIWIDNFDGVNPIEEELYGMIKKECDYKKLFKFCEDYMDEDNYKMMKPFCDKNQELKPKDYNNNLDKMYEMNMPLEIIGANKGEDEKTDDETSYEKIVSMINKQLK